MNPTDYALAFFVGAGLRDAEIIVAFARMINRKIKATESKIEFSVSLDTLIEKLDTYNPVKEIFNFISHSVDPRWKENVEGYACPDSESSVLKIRYITDAWQRLVVSGETPQSTALSIVIHRMTGCKETMNLLSRAGFGSSYTNVCSETKKLADDARNYSSFAPATISKGQLKHVTNDNSDRRQQTLTGLATTHYTNSTIYVPKLVTTPAEDANAESSNENTDIESSREIETPSSHDISNEHASNIHLFRERDDTKSYRIGTRSEPPFLTENNIVFEKDWLDERLDFDLTWCMAANHGNDDEIEMPPFRLWTVFSSMVTDTRTIQSDLDYFSVIP